MHELETLASASSPPHTAQRHGLSDMHRPCERCLSDVHTEEGVGKRCVCVGVLPVTCLAWLVLAKLSVSRGGWWGGGLGGPALPAASRGLGGDQDAQDRLNQKKQTRVMTTGAGDPNNRGCLITTCARG